MAFGERFRYFLSRRHPFNAGLSDRRANRRAGDRPSSGGGARRLVGVARAPSRGREIPARSALGEDIMLATLLLSSIAAATPVERFHARFPSSVSIGSVDGQRLVHASGFAQPVPGIPEAAARTFLAVYGSAFGVTGRQSLVLAGAPRAGQT